MFRSWAFTEMPYPHLPPLGTLDSVRVTLPNGFYDPDAGHELYKMYFDLFEVADELGLDIMLNEHHQTTTCLEAAVPLSLAVLCRTTKRARLLPLGNPLANRSDPIRVAEEMAMCDVISGGRLDVGFVRGVPEELSATNTNPVGMKDRLYEAADLIVKAWTTHDGPFNWEGEYFHHRQVNIWPRPYQQPHPKIWMPTLSPGGARDAAARGWTVATILNGISGCRSIFESYRAHFAERDLDPPPRERFAYLAFVCVGDTDEEAYQGAEKIRWHFRANVRPDHLVNVPGYLDPVVRSKLFIRKREQLRAAGSARKGENQYDDKTIPDEERISSGSLDDLIDQGFVFAGNPDTVFEQIVRFHDAVGGFGNLLMEMHSGTMSYELCRRSMELFSTEVQPRLREFYEKDFVGVVR